ncbi:MAG: hypothetical protein D6797_00350 [Bdellovibrio sp.]|nr:MAG: hypothetical protein D6797_00350 [Bdellovibrio sp.]
MNNASSLFTGKGMTCIEVAEVLAYESSEPITYEGVLKPLIFEPICASCHSPSGTMSTRNWLDYSTAQQHARNIASKVWGEMPPQGAEVRQLTTAEKELLQKWVEAGTPRGTGPIPAVLNCEK